MSRESTGPRKPRRPVHLPGQRAAIACIPCRQRKVRCTSGWPSCKACINRSIDCRYAGVSQGHPAMDIAPQAKTTSPSGNEARDLSQIPATELAQAADFFRDNFGSTLLFFIDPLTFSTQFCSGELSPSLTFAILALTARFSPWSSIEESRTYQTRAREFLRKDSNEVSLHVVQAYLIHCVYEVGCGFESSAWIHLGNAIRMAQILRLSVMDKPSSNFDWGRPVRNPSEDAITVELKRRTFWSCFFLDKLLSNGRDRPSIIDEKDICCHLPVSEEDLIFRRLHQPSTLSTVDLSHGTSSNLYVSLTSILSILGEIIIWHGRGGRYTDPRAPWKDDMPFTVLNKKLKDWQRQVSSHLQYSKDTFAAISMLNSNQLKVWGLAYLFFFLAKIYLLSEYIPFLPSKGYNPFDGPERVESVSEEWGNAPPHWWEGCIEGISRSSDSITELFRLLTDKLVVFPGVYPFIGLCLMKTAITHLFFTLIDEKGFRDTAIPRKAEALLQDDIKAMESLSRFWDLPKYWVR
ncbi:Mitochondrial import inner membrane translocase subunit Tim54 [Penicillium atrosanguineum]|uniref:Mitochondrial import inner membrane translocase subunit Tim54 n=1 Tax=Penicillium atrosanguineum TaxID=1132637 RepID=UPI002384FFC1|nr:Mitochondrial import inner membrane translocase subunit Tim54 [Penicillium atrosanguineum]KAJ5305088.1 Mitochondrial import inner membrane translocase subunit Tim54 [Penicillium atrosanguineum]